MYCGFTAAVRADNIGRAFQSNTDVKDYGNDDSTEGLNLIRCQAEGNHEKLFISRQRRTSLLRFVPVKRNINTEVFFYSGARTGYKMIRV